MGLTFGTFGIDQADLNEIVQTDGFNETLENGSIDTTNKWTETLVGTGASSVTNQLLLTTGATINSQIKLTLNQPQLLRSSYFRDNNLGFSKYAFEITLNVTGDSDIDHTKAFIGLATTSTSDRSSNDIIGFGFKSDGTLQVVWDAAGVEIVEDIGLINTIENFKIVFDATGFKFYNKRVLLKSIVDTSSTIYANIIINLENKNASTSIFKITNIKGYYIR